MYNIIYHKDAIKDIKNIDKHILLRIKNSIEKKLTERPEIFAQHLKHELKNYWKLRVGDYRVVFKIDGMVITILAIANRNKIYDMFNKRMKK
jgi:mRNA interferase RelE/StbE